MKEKRVGVRGDTAGGGRSSAPWIESATAGLQFSILIIFIFLCLAALIYRPFRFLRNICSALGLK